MRKQNKTIKGCDETIRDERKEKNELETEPFKVGRVLFVKFVLRDNLTKCQFVEIDKMFPHASTS